ncbi:hypothetical protein MTO96_040960, partial [Rhipicephalus appendiculatus]
RRLGSCEAENQGEIKSEDAVLWLFLVLPGRFCDPFDLHHWGRRF